MSVLEWTAAAAGAALVVLGLRDVFHTLLQPSAVGTVTALVFRAGWQAARRLGSGAMSLAGPVAIVATG